MTPTIAPGVKPPRGFSFIYALVDPETNVVRYVGRTRGSLSQRFSKHIRERAEEKERWLQSLKTPPQIQLLEIVPVSEEVFSEERWMARKHGALVNAFRRTKEERARHAPYNLRVRRAENKR